VHSIKSHAALANNMQGSHPRSPLQNPRLAEEKTT